MVIDDKGGEISTKIEEISEKGGENINTWGELDIRGRYMIKERDQLKY